MNDFLLSGGQLKEPGEGFAWEYISKKTVRIQFFDSQVRFPVI